MRTDFKIKNRYNLEIVGYVEIPEEPIGLAFTLHGLGSTKETPNITYLVDTFLKHNYIVVNFDATNSVGGSGGRYEYSTFGKHYEDLVDVISWAKNQEWYKEPFVLAGHSMGGYAVLQYAEDYPNEVKSVFAFAPTISGELSVKAKEKYSREDFNKWKETGWQIRESKSIPGVIKKLPWSHMEERMNHNLLINVKKLNMPVAILVGDKDEQCPLEQQEILFDSLTTKKDLYTIIGAPHTFRTEDDLNSLKKYLDIWLRNLI